ncbi:DUF2784 domain-containing protein [Mucilaginibacter auburnensis]|uniref:Uncharacterized protein DUF2784 n=1 Tax=Mucilaginibacter auburnensis TaxID=1457233 RepID=A0A2H9VL88_9SPHI|nr:DUF2784 domain-containing protein [Mucilaginibacter auburnensis]PJJ79109.1 uncharacterized protein DUF2784 [Mucilaginibacter auburnensis]
MIGLQLLDALLTFAHLLIVGFNLLGWMWYKTRKAHFVIVMITAACWFILGIWYGIGYCPVTDWQWQIKERLGEHNLPNSFIKYWADRITNSNVNTQLIDILTGGCFAAAFILTIYLNFIKPKRSGNAEIT